MTNFELAQLLDVENNFALLARDGLTFCNCYASLFCAARGVRLPPDVANKQLLYLMAHQGEWDLVVRPRAVELANASELVLAVAEHEMHGHIGPLVESLPADPAGAYVSAAGAHNFIRARLEASFGPLKPVFFHHRGATP